MNAGRQLIKNGYAYAALAIAMSPLGELVTYIARGVPLQVYCLPEGESDAQMIEMVGSQVRQRRRPFEIPTQTTAQTGKDNFPPTGGPMNNDVIVDENGDRFRLENIPNKDGLQAIWTLTGVCNTPKRS